MHFRFEILEDSGTYGPWTSSTCGGLVGTLWALDYGLITSLIFFIASLFFYCFPIFFIASLFFIASMLNLSQMDRWKFYNIMFRYSQHNNYINIYNYCAAHNKGLTMLWLVIKLFWHIAVLTLFLYHISLLQNWTLNDD